MYDFPRAPMGVPRVWAIKRDHGAPLGKRGTHGDGLVVARVGVLVVVGGGVEQYHVTTWVPVLVYVYRYSGIVYSNTRRPHATVRGPRLRYGVYSCIYKVLAK